MDAAKRGLPWALSLCLGRIQALMLILGTDMAAGDVRGRRRDERTGRARLARSISSTSRAPSSPPAASPHSGRGRRAPPGAERERLHDVRAAADAAVDEHLEAARRPRRRPPAGRRSSAVAPSSWRPPWLETITPAAPCSQASAASSAVRMPFTTTGRLDSGGELLEVVPPQRRVHQARTCRRDRTGRGRRPRRPQARGRHSAGIAKPVRRSRSRRPSRGASTVSAIASKPASSAWSISAWVTPRSRKQ